MKKILTIGLVMTMAVAMFAGCGKTENNQTSGTNKEDVYDYSNIKELVKLGQYEGLTVEVDPLGEVTDETVKYYLESLLASSAYVKDSSKTVVEADSVINVDYRGTEYGVAFEGGTATNQMINVGTNSSTAGTTYIDGFTSGLAGSKVGDTVSYEVKFPDDYGSDLAGKTVTFTFVINYIAKNITYDELTDENVGEVFGVENLAILKSNVKDMLGENTIETRNEDIRNSIESQIKANSTINISEDVVNDRVDFLAESYEAYYGTSMDNICLMYYGVTYSEYAVRLVAQAKESMTSELLFRAIAEDAGLKFEKSEYEAYVKNLMDSYGFETKDVLYETMKPSKKESGEEFVKNMYLCNKAMDYCIEKANVVDRESK